jgi:hypothetical protein
MNSHGSAAKYYRSILITALLTGVSLLASLSVLADQNTPTPGTIVKNQATAQFVDATDATDRRIISGKVTVMAVASTARDNGDVVIQLADTGATKQPDLLAIPGATAAGTPTTSYGWGRFRTKVDP